MCCPTLGTGVLARTGIPVGTRVIAPSSAANQALGAKYAYEDPAESTEGTNLERTLEVELALAIAINLNGGDAQIRLDKIPNH
jgi:hypothetical protein